MSASMIDRFVRVVSNRVVDLEADADARPAVTLDPEQRVARSRERVDENGCGAGRRRLHQLGDVAPDAVGQPVARAFDRGARQEPDSPRVPDRGSQPVDRHILGIAVAVAPVVLHLRQRQDGVALLLTEEKVAIVERRHGPE
jgi:hypothetical protein